MNAQMRVVGPFGVLDERLRDEPKKESVET